MIVNLHGRLGIKYGRKHKFKVRNAKEAIEALGANYSGFKQEIVSLTQKGIFYKAIKNNISPCKDAADYYEKCEEIDIVPSIMGAGGGLILAGLAAVGIGATFPALSFLVYIGIALILQGIALLLFPFEFDGEQEGRLETQSYIFNNTDNNAIQGFRVPLIYGQVRVGASVISTNIDAFDISQGVSNANTPLLAGF